MADKCVMKQTNKFNFWQQLDGRFYNWPAIIVAMMFFISWQLASDVKIISPTNFSNPKAILDVFWKMASTGELMKHVGISLYRILAGFSLGAFLGLITGLLTGSFPQVHRTLAPLLTALYGFPKIALLPLMIMAIGTGDAMRITLIAIVTYFPMWINTEGGVREVDKLLIRVAKNFGASEKQIVMKVAVPFIIPYIIAGLKYSAGLALHLIVIAEMINAQSGLGYLVWFSGTAFNMPMLFMAIFVLIVLSALLLGLFSAIERRIAPWKN